MIHADWKDAAVVDFSELSVDDQFWFATRSKEGQEFPYTKVAEERRPYTPESHSNATKFWRNVDQYGTIKGEGTTFFYVTPSSKVVKK